MTKHLSIDFSPFYRSTIGFDSFLTQAAAQYNSTVSSNYPPYNIFKTDKNTYRFELAVAGFDLKELAVEVHSDPNRLIITGSRSRVHDDDTIVAEEEELYRGIAKRDFSRVFLLADNVEVTSAKLVNGILEVVITRVIPEDKKPKQIQIQ